MSDLSNALTINRQKTQTETLRELLDQMYVDAIDEVTQFNGDDIYPPQDYPLIPGDNIRSSLLRNPESRFVGTMLPEEAIAFKTVFSTALAFAQAWGRKFVLSAKIDELLGSGENAWSSSAIDAMGYFLHGLSMASGVRERMSYPGDSAQKNTKSILEDAFLGWDEMFYDAIENDNRLMATRTTQAAVDYAIEQTCDGCTLDSLSGQELRKNQGKIAGAKLGASLVANWYLEALDRAGKSMLRDQYSR